MESMQSVRGCLMVSLVLRSRAQGRHETIFLLLENNMHFCVQRTIQELFEVYSPMDDAGFPVKAEEFVVLSQEPSITETIAPKIARPFIEVRTDPACPEELFDKELGLL